MKPNNARGGGSWELLQGRGLHLHATSGWPDDGRSYFALHLGEATVIDEILQEFSKSNGLGDCEPRHRTAVYPCRGLAGLDAKTLRETYIDPAPLQTEQISVSDVAVMIEVIAEAG